jgi:two-component system, cell cycle response regulator
MEKKDTKAVADQTIELQMSAWDNFTNFTNLDGCYFTVIEGADFGRIFLVDQPETVIGRSDEADIQVDDEKVSRRHIKILLRKNAAGKDSTVVIDLNSKNGVYVNSTRIHEQELNNGDKVKIGDTILKFELKDQLDISYHDRLYQQATRDPLTGLSNRRYFQNEFRRSFSIASRYGRCFSLLILDIDFFKKVNDTYGHDVGDQVLRAVAEVVLKHVRGQDIAARLGGEEFVMLLPDTPINGAAVVAERIRYAVENHNFNAAGCLHQITVSIGVGEYPSSSTSPDDVIKRADESLYRAKTSGRNRVCVASDPDNNAKKV